MTVEQIRADIRFQLSREFPTGSDALLIEEMDVCSGRARVDMAVICDRLIGIEIKGPKDDLHRLPGQVTEFSRCFDQVVLVVNAAIADEAAAIVPPWWGVVAIGVMEDAPYRYRQVRRPEQNAHLDLESVVTLLWRPELEEIWGTFLADPLPLKLSKSKVRKYLLQNVADDELKASSIAVLRNRRDWRSLPINKLPSWRERRQSA